MNRVGGKVALVTGAAGGIGLAILRMLRVQGAKAAMVDCDLSSVKADAHLPGKDWHL